MMVYFTYNITILGDSPKHVWRAIKLEVGTLMSLKVVSGHAIVSSICISNPICFKALNMVIL